MATGIPVRQAGMEGSAGQALQRVPEGRAGPIEGPPRSAAARRSAAPTRRRVFVGVWLASTAAMGWQVLTAQHVTKLRTFDAVLAVVALLACTAALLVWLGQPSTRTLPAAATTNRGRFALAIATALLVLLPGVANSEAAFGAVGVVGVIMLWRLRPQLSRRAVGYALVLGGLAAAGAFIEGWPDRHVGLLAWGVALLALVPVCLLAGWAISQRVGWTAAGIGPSRLLADGLRPALHSLLQGMVIGLPWGLSTLLFRTFEQDAYRTWWQPFSALMPGISEEAVARVFVLPLLYLVFRRNARAWPALLAAVAVGGYWFAFLHSPLLSPVFLLINSLPLTYLWLRRDLETAIGWHFAADFVRFLAAYLFVEGIWFA